VKWLSSALACLVIITCSCSDGNFDGEPAPTIVVLKAGSITFTGKPTAMAPPKQGSLSGELNSVCFVLQDGVDLQNADAMNELFRKLMNGVTIHADIQMSSGRVIPLAQPTESWSEDGVVLKHGEFSACSAPPCGVKVNSGELVSNFRVAANPAFTVKGVYWRSEQDAAKSSEERGQKSVVSADCVVPGNAFGQM